MRVYSRPGPGKVFVNNYIRYVGPQTGENRYKSHGFYDNFTSYWPVSGIQEDR